MSRLTDLIAQARPKIRSWVRTWTRSSSNCRPACPFGLNFERHRPEAVELPQRPIRKGDKVRVLRRPSNQPSNYGTRRIVNTDAL